MNRDLKGGWQHLKSELQHWSGENEDLDWIDARFDYTRGRVSVQHAPRWSGQDRGELAVARRR